MALSTSTSPGSSDVPLRLQDKNDWNSDNVYFTGYIKILPKTKSCLERILGLTKRYLES